MALANKTGFAIFLNLISVPWILAGIPLLVLGAVNLSNCPVQVAVPVHLIREYTK